MGRGPIRPIRRTAYYPPGYVAGGALLGFTAGVIVGGALWGNCNWGGGDVNINTNRYNNFNRTNINNSNWNHNAQHRGAVPYRDKGVAQQHGRGQAADAASRDQFRGRADAGRDSIQRGDVPRDAGSRGASAGTRDMQGGRSDFGGRERARHESRRRRCIRYPDRRRRADARLQQSWRVEHEFGALLRAHERRRRCGARRRRGRWRAVVAAAAVAAAAGVRRTIDNEPENVDAAGGGARPSSCRTRSAPLAATTQQTFATPEDAVSALVAAVKAQRHQGNARRARQRGRRAGFGRPGRGSCRGRRFRRRLRCEARDRARRRRREAHDRQATTSRSRSRS